MSVNPVLNKLVSHLENLTPDTETMIRRYWKDTGIKIGLIFALFQIRDQLQIELNPELDEKFNAVKDKFIQHIQKKISGECSAHRLDLLFEIKVIASNELTEAKSIVIKDIEGSSYFNPDLKASFIKAFHEERYGAILDLLPPEVTNLSRRRVTLDFNFSDSDSEDNC